MKKFFKFLFVYILIGVMVTQYRVQAENWSRGGPEIAIAALIYPLIYPFAEAARFIDSVEEGFFRRGQAARHVALLCPPAYKALFREAVLERRRGFPAAPYDSLVKTLKKNPPDPADPRTGYVLHQVALAAGALGDTGRVRGDAAAFAENGNTAGLRTAAALLGGAYAATSGDAVPAGEVLEMYEHVYAGAAPAEAPFAAYALGTAYEARGMREAALGRYREAIRSGWIDLGAQALVRAVAMADSDEERLEITELFADLPRENVDDQLERRLNETGWGDPSDLGWFRRRYEAALILGRPLFPLPSPAAEGAQRFDAFFAADLAEDNVVGRGYGWQEELIMGAEPAFSTFPARLGMVELLLRPLLDFEEGRIYIDQLLYRRTREVYYRLYAETQDRRWLDCALPSQLNVQPRLEKFAGYIRGELAFMQGEYRKHFHLVERRYLEHGDYPTVPNGLSFLGRKMRDLEIRVGEKSRDYAYALEQYQLDLSDELYRKNAREREDKLRLFEAGELQPPFHDFSDSDVFEKTA